MSVDCSVLTIREVSSLARYRHMATWVPKIGKAIELGCYLLVGDTAQAYNCALPGKPAAH